MSGVAPAWLEALRDRLADERLAAEAAVADGRAALATAQAAEAATCERHRGLAAHFGAPAEIAELRSVWAGASALSPWLLDRLEESRREAQVATRHRLDAERDLIARESALAALIAAADQLAAPASTNIVKNPSAGALTGGRDGAGVAR